MVDKKISTLNLANTTYGATQSLLYSKKLDALEKAWNAFLYISKNKPSIIGGRLDILTPQEYENLFDIPAMRDFPILEDDMGQLIKKLSDIVDPIENLKIYIDDDIWTFLFIYRAVMLRIYYLITKAKENRQLKLRWHKDGVILNHLNMIFNQSELQEFEKIQIGKFRYVENVLEAKLKVRIEEGLSGGKASEAMLQQALQNQLMLDKLSKKGLF